MASFVTDILVGALGPGVNHPTFIALNAVIALAFGSLLFLLFYSVWYYPPLTPHVIALLVLALGLWVSINWLVANVGLVDAEQQQKDLGLLPAEGDQQQQQQAEGAAEQVQGAAGGSGAAAAAAGAEGHPADKKEQ